MDPRHTCQRGMQARPAVDKVSDCVVAARRLWEDECNIPLRALCHAQHAAELRQRLGVCDAGAAVLALRRYDAHVLEEYQPRWSARAAARLIEDPAEGGLRMDAL